MAIRLEDAPRTAGPYTLGLRDLCGLEFTLVHMRKPSHVWQGRSVLFILLEDAPRIAGAWFVIPHRGMCALVGMWWALGGLIGTAPCLD